MSPSAPLTRDSDSEDEDYVPLARDESSSDESEQEANEQGSAPVVQAVEDAEEKKRKRDALWADFQTSVTNGSKSSVESPPKKKVKIEKKYRFAGEETTEVIEVDEDSLDARQWPLWKSPNEAPATNSEDAAVVAPKDSSTSVASFTPVSSLEPSTSNKPLPPSKKPGPRKPKTTLVSLPSSSKAKRLTTLDKSAMDWQVHLQASGSGVQDELEANRRGGGYLEKVEFLQRVEDRKEENLDALKSTKRRRL